MTDEPAKRIGAYELDREIGRGGMGVVYLAHDPKLDRPVAIKALNEDFVEHPERLARFEREARVLASLSHGNIATVYGSEETDGHRFLVMEFVEGQTLADRLADGPLPLNEALSICAQIAAGVEAAHEEGVVHRDLKPGNVIIRPDGTAKVLDFGLARELPARSSRTGGSSLAEAATVPAAPVTEQGTPIGTPGYMSPEQVRGMSVDRRTDNFAFGCILYECLVGRLAFPGDTATEAIAAILERQPDWSLLPPNTPPTIQLLLRRCLQKDRRRRLRDIGDARIEIEQAIDDPTSTVLGLADAALLARGRIRQRSWGDLVPWAVALIALAALPLVWIWTRPAPAPPLVPLRFSIDIPDDCRLAPSPHPAISADGLQFVFLATDAEGRFSLYSRRFDQMEPTKLEGAIRAWAPLFSPDGEWLAFDQFDKLKKMSVRGGPSTTLCDAQSFRGGSWGRDGTIVFAPESLGGLFRVLEAGGTPEQLTTPDASAPSHRDPFVLPDGRGVLFTATSDGAGWEETSVMLYAFGDGTTRRLFDRATHAHYVSTGHIVFLREGTLMAALFDLEQLEATGPEVPVLENITTPGPASPRQFAIAANGTLTYMSGAGDEARYLELFDLDSKAQRVGALSGDFEQATISPDDELIAIEVESDGRTDIKILERERDILRPLTFDEADDQEPIWSPDGRWICFASKRHGGQPNLYRVPSDFTGTPERLTTSERDQSPTDWSPDGRTIIFVERDPETQMDIYMVRLDEAGAATGEAETFVKRPGWQWFPKFSPDGRWVSYTSTESGRPEVYVRPASGPGRAEQASVNGGYLAVWSPNETRLFYTSSFTPPVDVYSVTYQVDDEGTFRALPAEKLCTLETTAQSLNHIDLTNDGTMFLVTSIELDSAAARREPIVVLNWFEELKAKTAVLGAARR